MYRLSDEYKAGIRTKPIPEIQRSLPSGVRQDASTAFRTWKDELGTGFRRRSHGLVDRQATKEATARTNENGGMMRKTILVQIIFITAMLAFVTAPREVQIIHDIKSPKVQITATPTATPTTVVAKNATTQPTPKPTKRPTPKPTAKPTPKPTTKPTKTRSGLRVGDRIKGSLTYYCCCPRCCGSHVRQVSKGVYRSTTASGMRVQTGQAPPYPIVSCNWLPLGSKVEVNGTIYTVEDRGGGGLSRVGALDVYLESHAKALKLGRKSATIRIVRIGR